MVEMITGVPGSGKTSYAITRLAKTFSKDEDLKKKIPNQFLIPYVDKAFTNINELKVDELNNVSAIHFDDLVEKLTVLEENYRKNKWDDKQLNELATEYGINNAMFIIDECHNNLDVPNKVLTWWLSYHRHLHQHIILLTQNLSLVNTKYKAFPEIYLKAIPATLKVFNNNIVLKKYTNSRMSKNSQAGQVRVKKFNEVFALYGSGANHKVNL
jgi:zona occludens toxin